MEDLDRIVVVCDACLRACCWQGQFMCQESRGAGIKEMTVRELVELNREQQLEHPDCWKEPN